MLRPVSVNPQFPEFLALTGLIVEPIAAERIIVADAECSCRSAGVAVRGRRAEAHRQTGLALRLVPVVAFDVGDVSR